MIKQNLGQLLAVAVLVAIQSANADANGTGVDLQQFDGELAVYLDAKNVSGTTPTLDVKLQDSADNSTGWADISGAAFTQVTNANSSAAVLQKINLRADQVKRYVRAVIDVGGTTPVFLVACFAVGVNQIES